MTSLVHFVIDALVTALASAGNCYHSIMQIYQKKFWVFFCLASGQNQQRTNMLEITDLQEIISTVAVSGKNVKSQLGRICRIAKL